MWRNNVLWVDGVAAAVAGIVVLLAGDWLSEWYRLPSDLLRFVGLVNLVYASYSLSLAAHRNRPKILIVALVIANITWAVVCVRWALVFADTAGFFGLAHLVGEAIFVAGLATFEWRSRTALWAKT